MELQGFDVRLSGRIVLVTGAASGIGRECARALAGAGAHVALVDLDTAAVVAVRTELQDAGATATAYSADITDPKRVAAVVAEAWADLGPIDGLVASAGIHRTEPFLDIHSADWEKVLKTNLNGTFHVVQEVGRQLMDSGTPGSMVLISSVSGRTGRPQNAHYAASKAAVISLVQSSAHALAPLVRVNGVCPGSVDTPMLERFFADRDASISSGDDPAAHVAIAAKSSLMKRNGIPEDISDAVIFLLGDRASFITGQSLNVDGGSQFN